MQGLGYVLFFPLFVIGMFAIGAYLYLSWSIERHLEKWHHATWVSLGCPNLIRNNSLLTSKNLHRFLRALNPADCDDPELFARVKQWRRSRVGVAAIFLSMAAALVLDVLLFR
jgi:hypothetical protein